MTATPLLIHIGYHKTGTTWLQRRLFQPDFGYRSLLTHDEVFSLISKPHSLFFNPAPAHAFVEQRRQEMKNESAHGSAVDVISSEILSGNPFYGGRESMEFARRLKATFPDAFVLITIREQFAMMASVYMQYLLRSGRLSPQDFFSENPVIGYDAFSTEHFHFDRLVAYYHNLFGAKNVLVLTQEQLAAEPLSFMASLSAFTRRNAPGDATPANDRTGVSYPEYAAPVLRRINYCRSGPAGRESLLPFPFLGQGAYRLAGKALSQKWVRGLFFETKPVTRFVKERFEGRFAKSNQRLQALVDGDLNLAGYEGAQENTSQGEKKRNAA